MARTCKMAARAARRAAMILPNLPRSRKKSKTRSDHPQQTCPYCSKTLTTLVGRDQHILLKPYCRRRHQVALSQQVNKECVRKRKRDATQQGETGASEPGSKQPRLDGEMPANEPGPTEDDSDDQICEEVFIERFPINTAGKPISTKIKPKPDLRAYVESCGKLPDPDLFDTAELLFMTVPRGKDRTKHLQSKRVSVRVLCRWMTYFFLRWWLVPRDDTLARQRSTAEGHRLAAKRSGMDKSCNPHRRRSTPTPACCLQA